MRKWNDTMRQCSKPTHTWESTLQEDEPHGISVCRYEQSKESPKGSKEHPKSPIIGIENDGNSESMTHVSGVTDAQRSPSYAMSQSETAEAGTPIQETPKRRKIAEAKAKLSDHVGDYFAICDNEIGSLEEQLADAKSEIAHLKDRITKVVGQLEELKGKHEELKGKHEAANNEKEEMKGKLDTSNKKLVSKEEELQEELQEVKGKLEAYQSKFDIMQNVFNSA